MNYPQIYVLRYAQITVGRDCSSYKVENVQIGFYFLTMK